MIRDMFDNSIRHENHIIARFDGMPTADAWNAESYTVAELDAHPDRARIWATIEAARASAHEYFPSEEERYEEVNEAEKEGFEKGQSTIADAMDGAVIGWGVDEGRLDLALDGFVPDNPEERRLLDLIQEKLAEVAESINEEYEF